VVVLKFFSFFLDTIVREYGNNSNKNCSKQETLQQRLIFVHLAQSLERMGMGSVCRCLFQYCCESQGGDDDVRDNNDRSGDRIQQSYSSVSDYAHPIEGQGLISGNSRGEQQQQQRNSLLVDETITPTSTTLPISNADDEDDDDRGNVRHNNCCQPSSDYNEPSSLLDIIRRRMNRWQNNPYNAVVMGDDPNSYVHHFSNTTTTKTDKKMVPSQQSPLRQALTFNLSTCTINSDEIVLPGSIIQQQMAQQMKLCSKNVVQGNIDECVICMEPFDSSNPRMPTVCNCGVNKTYFHLPCLYQWIEQSEECPSCRTKITWEEF
jgi:Ring finger domain